MQNNIEMTSSYDIDISNTMNEYRERIDSIFDNYDTTMKSFLSTILEQILYNVGESAPFNDVFANSKVVTDIEEYKDYKNSDLFTANPSRYPQSSRNISETALLLQKYAKKEERKGTKSNENEDGIQESLKKINKTLEDLVKVNKLHPQDKKKSSLQKINTAAITKRNESINNLLINDKTLNTKPLLEEIQSNIQLTNKERMFLYLSIQERIHKLENIFMKFHFNIQDIEKYKNQINNSNLTTEQISVAVQTYNLKAETIWKHFFDRSAMDSKKYTIDSEKQGLFTELEATTYNAMTEIFGQEYGYHPKLEKSLKSTLQEKQDFAAVDSFSQRIAQYASIYASQNQEGSPEALNKFVTTVNVINPQQQQALKLFISPIGLEQIKADLKVNDVSFYLSKQGSAQMLKKLNIRVQALLAALTYGGLHAAISISPLLYKLNIPVITKIVRNSDYKIYILTSLFILSSSLANYTFNTLLEWENTTRKQFQNLQPPSKDGDNTLLNIFRQVYTNALKLSHLNIYNSCLISEQKYNQIIKSTPLDKEKSQICDQISRRYGKFLYQSEKLNAILENAESIIYCPQEYNNKSAKSLIIGNSYRM